MNMDIESLRSFIACVENDSFTRAANQLHRTQSAISMQMKKLQEDVGKPLFEKSGRKLHLTQDGHTLMRYAKQLVRLHDDTLAHMRQSERPTLLRLGCPDDYADTILPSLTAQLHQLWQNLELDIHCMSSNRIKDALDQGELDLGVITRSPDSEEGLFLYHDQGVWVGTWHPETSISLAVFQRDCRFHQAAIEGLMKQERTFKVIANCQSASALRALVKAGLAIGALAQSSAEDLPILSVQGLPPLPSIDVVLIRSNTPSNPVKETDLLQISRGFHRAD
ncbi:LysR family transcriptional regulator [Pseudoalteromonas rubra]|uniref:LysR family transcriptional regulator n=1 Tax=Pseudoalteromonas rubra TaxID=43658 RepID=A0A5S3WH47_9GAMM|nr:LysR substrate-binding domain-containing protein [Pseudoalteromonas rubra]TMP26501.1 LysR family transcriptional regulator [Pseudoalteromonas rubra]TMP32879.1 LysR family transcriptional regulator [Pseudoalteromonas rubra]